ncbi:MAG: hypothetical protein HC936_09825 [Leptolyngbyaceae cyanobacterium SU_3_3]|nr:hypothetical protein [Leptolyngbyaceae cyanobacterium SU_3_3]
MVGCQYSQFTICDKQCWQSFLLQCSALHPSSKTLFRRIVSHEQFDWFSDLETEYLLGKGNPRSQRSSHPSSQSVTLN